MMRSLSSAVAGLRTHQTKMDVIGNNIANVNTFGFKYSRTTFQDVYYQNLSSGSRANGAISGGTNPTQIGYGSSVATIDVMISRAGSSSTDRALDVYLSGEGFIAAKDNAGNMIYTRLGNLRFDGEGNLVDGMGNFIQGFPKGADGNPIISPNGTITGGELQRIRCSPEILDELTGIQISPTGAIVGILPGEAEFKPNGAIDYIDPQSIYIPPDSVYTGDVNMIIGCLPDTAELNTFFGAGATVTKVDFGDKGFPPGAADDDYTMRVVNGRVVFTDSEGTEYTGFLNEKTNTLELKNKSGDVAMVITFEPGATMPNIPGDQPLPSMNGADMKFQVTTTDKGGNVVKLPSDETLAATPNANLFAVTPAGGIGTDGSINLDGIQMMLSVDVGDIDTMIEAIDKFSMGTAGTSEGERLPIGNLALAKFRNAAGLEETGTSYFMETFNSGTPIFVRPGLEGTGALKSGYLEMSNVDLSKEFTEMITTQRGFQSNSRIVTVSDEMLQELVNLKR